MIMKNWLANAHVDCPQKGQSLDEYFKKEANIIDENDIILDVASYLNVDE
jgi:hypothetical protein